MKETFFKASRRRRLPERLAALRRLSCVKAVKKSSKDDTREMKVTQATRDALLSCAFGTSKGTQRDNTQTFGAVNRLY